MTSYAAEPRVLVDGFRLERVAKEPEIVTPVGLSFDTRGRLLVVENHTHQRRPEYAGPATDRIRLFSDADGDGKLDRWSTFAEGFRPALNVLARPDGGVYVVTRGQVVLLFDRDHDGAADDRTEILRLDTTQEYPHNGLSGIAIDSQTQELVIGLGENFGSPAKLVGTDGATIAVVGGKSGVFRCSLAGGNLRQIATGFWNPFSVCVAPHGRVFAVDNDPDSSPPCRLLHVVPGGDYGYLFQYGRTGLHPLQAWDGQLPGTLPMVSGVGEAPTALVAHRGRLWVTSWGEHAIEAYRLVPQGASFTATREVIVQGDADFRPTGMAVAPDGSLYFGDWVKRDYPVHGMGRIWRLALPDVNPREEFPQPTPGEAQAAALRRGENASDLVTADPFLEAAAAFGLSTGIEHVARGTFGAEGDSAAGAGSDAKASAPRSSSSRRLRQLAAWRLSGADVSDEELRGALADASPAVRLFAVRWIADERRTSLAADVSRLLEGEISDERYYLGVIAAVDWLTNPPGLRNSRFRDGLLVRELRNTNRTPEVHALALRLVSPNNAFLTQERLRAYVQSGHAAVRLAAVRALVQQSDPERFQFLAELAESEDVDVAVRAEAVMGLAGAAERFRPLLDQLSTGANGVLRDEANRVLRLAGLLPAAAENKPPVSDLPGWLAAVEGTGDAAAGRRLFFSEVGSRCAVCHQHGGQGGMIGPDLTDIGARISRERLLASILRPSEEIAPRYQTWVLVTVDGKTLSGQRLAEAGDNGSEEYVDSAGRTFSLPSEAIESRAPANVSLMPDGLERLIFVEDLRDLLAFLTADAEAIN